MGGGQTLEPALEGHSRGIRSILASLLFRFFFARPFRLSSARPLRFSFPPPLRFSFPPPLRFSFPPRLRFSFPPLRFSHSVAWVSSTVA